MFSTQAELQSFFETFRGLSQEAREAVSNKAFLHEHLLELRRLCERRICNACGESIYDVSRLTCEACNFDLHSKCSTANEKAFGISLMSRTVVCKSPVAPPKLPTTLKEYENLLSWDKEALVNRHCIHDHPMIWIPNGGNNLKCDGCGGGYRFGASWYLCHPCGFSIHQECSAAVAKALGFKLQAKAFAEARGSSPVATNRDVPAATNQVVTALAIQHPFHHHSLHLTNPPSALSLITCDGCNKRVTGSRYRCQLCDFDLHYDCAMSSQSRSTVTSNPNPVGQMELGLAMLKLNSSTTAPVTSSRAAVPRLAAAPPLQVNQQRGLGMGNSYSLSRDLQHTLIKAATKGVVRETIHEAFHHDDHDHDHDGLFSSVNASSSSLDNSTYDGSSFSYGDYDASSGFDAGSFFDF